MTTYHKHATARNNLRSTRPSPLSAEKRAHYKALHDAAPQLTPDDLRSKSDVVPAAFVEEMLARGNAEAE